MLQSQATIGAPGGICDKPRRWRMPLAKAASEMVRGGAIGSVSRKMDAGRLAQLRSRACDLRPAAPAVLERSRRDWKAPAAAPREYSQCADGSISRMTGEVRARVSSGHRPAALLWRISHTLWRWGRMGPSNGRNSPRPCHMAACVRAAADSWAAPASLAVMRRKPNPP
jgi:hypothetical protein